MKASLNSSETATHSDVQSTVNKFLKYYESPDSRPVFETVDEMLKWAGLYNLTRRTLQEELVDAGLSPVLIQELVTVRYLANFLYGSFVYMLKLMLNVLLLCFSSNELCNNVCKMI